MFQLVICTNEGKTLRRFDLSRIENSRSRLVIGRSDDCDIRINSSAVSRHHVAIEPDPDDDGWIVRDLGSTHGMSIKGVKLPQAEITDGLQVVIGPALLRFEAPTQSVAADIARELGELRD